ncbi:MucBP domain-containing protein [Streptococcus oriscaviae]|uniref:MucBP domain-containing protein n=1 Tax=Streptococcus oriscaviae TaxID=2781599 RepID=A0ABX7YIU3_9STRE|nr:MucBP domain-containing protein [Streptococcus oriscaviae]QUE53562.1 MucBP domain-containing protein [Streptococcus oriscaviae]
MLKNMVKKPNHFKAHQHSRFLKGFGLVCGVVLAGVVLLSPVVSAEEITTTSVEVEVVEVIETVPVSVEATDDLNAAVELAKGTEGVQVNELPVNDLGLVDKNKVTDVVDAVKEDYAQQAESIVATVEAHQAEIVAVEVHNASEDKRYAEEVAAYNEALKEAKSQEIVSSDGITVYGQFDDTKKESVQYYGGIKVLVDNASYTSENFLNGAIRWNDDTQVVEVKNATVREDSKVAEDYYAAGGYIYMVEGLKKGASFKITNLGKTQSGGNINAVFTVSEDLSTTGTERLRIFKSQTGDGAITFGYLDSQYLPLDIDFVDDKGNVLNLVVSVISGDLDAWQAQSLRFDGKHLTTLIPSESGLSEKDGYQYDGTKAGIFVNDFDKAPLGTLMYVGSGSINYTHYASYLVADGTRGKTSPLKSGTYKTASGELVDAGIQFSLFGDSMMVSKVIKVPEVPVYKDRPETKVVTFQLSKFDVEKDKGLIRVRYVDDNGNILEDWKESSNYLDKPYETTEKVFDGYEFKLVEGNPVGYFVAETQEIVYVYKKKPVVTPETPKIEPEAPKVVNQATVATLPNTGDTATLGLSFVGVGLLLLSVLGQLGFVKKRN